MKPIKINGLTITTCHSKDEDYYDFIVWDGESHSADFHFRPDASTLAKKHTVGQIS